MFRFSHLDVAALTGAALLFHLWAQHWTELRLKLGSAVVCWAVLPHLFRLSRRFDASEAPHRWQYGGHGVSSGSLWILAVSLAVFYSLQGLTGLTEAFPFLTPLLLAAQPFLVRGYAQFLNFTWISSLSCWGPTLTAFLIAFTLSNGDTVAFLVSVGTVAPLSLLYVALLSKSASRWRYLPHIDDFEEAVTDLSWRTVLALLFAFGVHTFFYGVALDGLVQTAILGLLEAFAWYFTVKTSRHVSWCIAPAIATFGLAAMHTGFTSTHFQGLLVITASALALAQVIWLLPPSAKSKMWLWVFLLVPIAAFLSMAWETRNVRAIAQTSFLADIHHPIETLMDESKAKFEETLGRQSRNYTAADAEYRRRYGIEPPPGFEAWFDFAVANQSPLIDDFDTIYHSISPFWRINASELKNSMDKIQGISGSETWRCRFSSANTKTTCSHPSRTFDRHIQTLFNRLSDMPDVSIPDVEFLANHFDEPRIVFPANLAEHDGNVELSFMQHQRTWDMLTENCPPTNPASTHPIDTFGLPFVKNISSSKDLCRHPEYEKMHGLLVSPTTFSAIKAFAPVLSTGTLSTMGDILFPSPAYTESDFLYDSTKDIPWEHKRLELYWAGSTTGGFSQGNEWHHFHRQRFVTLAKNLKHVVYPYLQEARGVVTLVAKSFIPQPLFNVAFTNFNQCRLPTCLVQYAFFHPSPRADAHRALKSRLVFDTDGNGISGRYYRLLASHSLPLKQTLLREWHDDRLIPWVHYIPVSLGMEEVPEMVGWLLENERGRERAREVAESGRVWSARALREVDASIYVYRLFLELARLGDPERGARGG